MSTSTTSPVPSPSAALLPGAPEIADPVCPVCTTSSRWAGSPADSGFLAYCPSCDETFHVTVAPITGGTIRLP
jgi:hypothetical protein